MTEMEPELIPLLAQKAQDIEVLTIGGVKGATTQVKQELANLAVSVIQQTPVNLKVLSLHDSGFSSEMGGKICSALAESSISSI